MLLKSWSGVRVSKAPNCFSMTYGVTGGLGRVTGTDSAHEAPIDTTQADLLSLGVHHQRAVQLSVACLQSRTRWRCRNKSLESFSERCDHFKGCESSERMVCVLYTPFKTFSLLHFMYIATLDATQCHITVSQVA